jgi:hypothetical protein
MKTIVILQVMYRPYKRAYTFFLRYSTTLIIIFTFDTLANKLLSTAHLKYFSAYVHIDVMVKSLELSSIHEDVKFKFISLFGVAAQQLDMKIRCHVHSPPH